MRLDRLRAMVTTISVDGTSPIADAAAARWGLPRGCARHVRTGASSVFAADGGYLRLVSAADRPVRAGQAVADVMTALKHFGAPVIAPRPSLGGRLVEPIDTELPCVGLVHATLVEAAPGRLVDLDEVTVVQAEQWGSAMAELHHAGRSMSGVALPTWFDIVQQALTWVPCDTELGDVAGRLLERCVAAFGQPRTLVHGDPQADNASWASTGPVFFDLDDASVAWGAVDLAMAVRDLHPIDAFDRPICSTPIGTAVLRGYRAIVDFDDDQEQSMPLVQRLSSIVTYGRLKAVLATPEGEQEPDWLCDIRGRLQNLAQRLRRALTAA